MSDLHWQLLDWRRRVARLYEAVRDAGQPRVAHALWVEGRDGLLRHHPASPVPEDQRETYAGARVAPYDGDYRFVVEVETDLPPARREVQTATDGVVPFQRVGRVTLPGLGPLDLWWVSVYGGGLFLPLKDASSGSASYGGGRYVSDTVKGADLGGERD
ncbi:MAG: DUF1684 domain-containing protein, partial [Actinobacteria bacterium]|nr:DUF1684 domain-containing protein [Actinomycetota bacterium]